MTIRLGDILSVLAIIVSLVAVYTITTRSTYNVWPYYVSVVTTDAVATEVVVLTTKPLSDLEQIRLRQYVRQNVGEYSMEAISKDPLVRTNLDRHITSDLSRFDIDVQSVWFRSIIAEFK